MSSFTPSFFANYPTFDHHPRRSVQHEFDRLAKQQGWSKKETTRKRAQCYETEFEEYFADLHIETQLEKLQHLCLELDVEIKTTVTQCKKVLKKTHVNIVDLMDSRRTGNKVKKFPSEKQLVEYTLATKKVFPREEAKADVVKVLLKVIFRHG